jgi:phosphatidylserine decarboxylase
LAFVTTFPDRIDVRRLAGWLPEDQGVLESWLAGHRLHPVLAEFQTLIGSDPVVRM